MKDDAGLRIFHALSGAHCCNAMRVVFFEAVHAGPRSLSDIAVRDETNEARADRRPQENKNRRLLTLIHSGFFEAENKADTCVSFAAVERSMLDSLRREHCLFPFHAMRFRKEVMPSWTWRSEKKNVPAFLPLRLVTDLLIACGFPRNTWRCRECDRSVHTDMPIT